MSMRSEIIATLTHHKHTPMTAVAIVREVRERSGVEWKDSSIRKALGVLVTRGMVTNLDRDPVTGFYKRIPCRYELAS